MKTILIGAILLSIAVSSCELNASVDFSKQKEACGKSERDLKLEEKKNHPHYRDIFVTRNGFKTEFDRLKNGDGC